MLLGKRIAFQPDLDTSAAILAFGRSPLIPGQLLGDPGPPLSNLQVKALLEELYRLEARPALPTSSKPSELDISKFDDVEEVYVKIDEPHGLASRYEGPLKIVSRPSRSQVQVRVGSYVNGEPRLLTYHWSSCKPANRRYGAPLGERPNLGRRPKSDPEPPSTARPIDPSDQNKLTGSVNKDTTSAERRKKNILISHASTAGTHQ